MSHSIEVETFDFIEAISPVDSINQLAHLFKSKITSYGFTNFLVTNLPPTTTSFEADMIHCEWPEVWRDHYFACRYWVDDPVAHRVSDSRTPFFWSDVAAGGAAQRVMDEAASIGLKEGFTIPLSAPLGAVSCVSMAGPSCEFPPRGQQALQLMATYTHMKAVELQPPRWKTTTDQRVGLTTRELECLRWAADGKTDWEISTILRISEETAYAHVRNAIKKLGCVNRTQAVARALYTGQMRL